MVSLRSPQGNGLAFELKAQWPCLCRSGRRSRNNILPGSLGFLELKLHRVETCRSGPRPNILLFLSGPLVFLEFQPHRSRRVALDQAQETIFCQGPWVS